jgi:hypothetical protein
MTLGPDTEFALPDPRFPELGVWADLAPHPGRGDDEDNNKNA